ncbi:MAG: beta-lactamase family protein [Roseivirga sp.]|nr:beta-lactamase family protein [Roseivirga sp.]
MKGNYITGFLNTTTVVLMLFLLIGPFNSSSQAQKSQYEWVNEFISTYNSHDQARMKSLLLDKFHKAYHGTAKYWQGVYKEFGQVKLLSVGKDTINGRAIIWTRSTNTENFVAFAYKLAKSAPLKINRMGVIRGMIPSGLTRKVPDLEQAAERINTHLEKLEHLDVFSGTVLVAHKGQILINKAVNFSERQTKIPNDANTRFLIASTTKMFTATAIAQLVERGLLNYNDPISKHLPDYPAHIGSKVTIHHLLTHSSGIELDEIGAYNKSIARVSNLEELYQTHLKYLPKLKNYDNYKLPEEFNYTNEGFDLAGYIVQKVSGEDFFDYLAKHVFEKGSMDNTGDFELDKEIANLARGYYSSKSDERKLNTRHLPARSRPAGSFYSTSHDLFRFVQSLQNGTLMKQETFERVTSSQITSYVNPISSSKYGYGFSLNSMSGLESWGHAGVAPGMGARCDVYPESGFTVIVLSNYDKAAAIVANYIRDTLHFQIH